ncbi:hypothetical protein GQ54DRAFT_281323, partial [Martensiomyces pterosporus]
MLASGQEPAYKTNASCTPHLFAELHLQHPNTHPPHSQTNTHTKMSYTLRYFPIRTRAETCRALLSYSGAPWENVHPEWPAEKHNQPFGKMPVLIERSEDGSEFVLSDSVAIEKYLATKYGLAVTGDARAVAHQDELRNQLRDIYELIVLYMFGHEDVRPDIMDKFNTLAKALVRFHEEFLKKNGSNGHYFGKKTTYVDI